MAPLEAVARSRLEVDPAISHAAFLNTRYAGWGAHDILAELIHEEFAGHIALVSSFGAQSVVLLHLIASIHPGTPIIFIDTGKLFGSTLRYRDEMVDRFGLMDVRVVRPDSITLAERDADSVLWMRDSDQCCAIRKIAPLAAALTEFDAWISGRKRYQGGARAGLPLVEPDEGRIKINPLAYWTRGEIAAYRMRHDLPEHPLVADGFRSIGCMPCTTRVAEGEDERDGRWRGTNKKECGIHAVLEKDGSGI
jgi:phosphoadenosine phosphosulfate reductase